VLFTSSPVTAAWDDANIVVQRLPAGERKIVLHGGYYARYLPSGHLVYVHAGTFFAVPFDLDRLEIAGEPVPVLPSVIASSVTGGAQFAASDNGTVAYLPGRGQEINNVPIVWVDGTGKTAALRPSPGNWTGLLFSPDGSRLAMDISDGKQRDLWTYEWERDTLSRLTFEPVDDANPVWTPDGRRIAFGSKRGNAFYNLYWQPADGSGTAERLLESRDSHLIPGSWHPSGRYLAFHQITHPNDPDLMILPMEGSDNAGWKPGVPQVFLKTPAAEQVPMFSPVGRWIAYYSNESGRNEVYVRPFPGPGGQWQISVTGGTYPTWSRTKPELFYATLDQHIMVVHYRADGNSFQADKPVPWMDATFTDGHNTAASHCTRMEAASPWGTCQTPRPAIRLS
jgi:eukaryotic-like serine/threonine-protein kinase